MPGSDSFAASKIRFGVGIPPEAPSHAWCDPCLCVCSSDTGTIAESVRICKACACEHVMSICFSSCGVCELARARIQRCACSRVRIFSLCALSRFNVSSARAGVVACRFLHALTPLNPSVRARTRTRTHAPPLSPRPVPNAYTRVSEHLRYSQHMLVSLYCRRCHN